MNAKTASLVLVALLVAGCTQPPPDEKPPLFTASRAHPAAREAARLWDPNATLVVVAGHEGNVTDPGYNLTVSGDGSLGEGAVARWDLIYLVGSNATSRLFTVALEGLVGQRATTTPANDTIPSWNVDSDRAAALVKAHESAKPVLAKMRMDGASYILVATPEGAPLWRISFWQEGHGIFGLVDATTGDVIGVFPF